MHPLIDENMVNVIRETGNTNENLPDRKRILEENDLPYDRVAENAIITGCQILPMLPHILGSLSRIFDQKGFSYTFLSDETCCGNYLYRPVIQARDEEAMTECRNLSKEFVARTIKSARKCNARRLVIFCSPCYPIYRHAFPEEDIVFYPVAINEVMGKIHLAKKIDYYAGCYRLHKRMSPIPMDLKSTENIFSKVDGLDINRISAPKCCFHPEGLDHMLGNVSTGLMVHICSGCYGQAVGNMPKEKQVEILMLPEFIERVMIETPSIMIFSPIHPG